MRHRKRGWTQRLPAALAGVLAACLWCAPAAARDYGGYYGSGYNDRGYGPGRLDSLQLRQDMARLRDQMRVQQLQLQQQIRLQEEQIRLLRQQLSAQHQMTAVQACHYRFGAGIETCEALFDADTPELASCAAKVRERNPGCAPDVSRVARRPKG